jgi:hypothetical protein
MLFRFFLFFFSFRVIEFLYIVFRLAVYTYVIDCVTFQFRGPAVAMETMRDIQNDLSFIDERNLYTAQPGNKNRGEFRTK